MKSNPKEVITEEDVRTFQRIAAKIKDPGQGLPQGVFDALCKLVPFPACELVVVNADKEVLLTWRDDGYWRGWHFPGGLMRMNEDFISRLNKTAQREFGCKVISAKYLFPFNYPRTARGHDVSFIFLCKIKGKPTDGKFFKKMPKDLIAQHREVFRRLKKLGVI